MPVLLKEAKDPLEFAILLSLLFEQNRTNCGFQSPITLIDGIKDPAEAYHYQS
ncbi:hypothetical protein I79_010361 [Cricetulus griseus]|uniref:Uncharacterized protein n=1 Tax=Cricetulus griseus TaxID=10029 RepID=G3HI94_CRIGR|nr:hypothetical protein I79_010361 [Cricetulus griseus]